MLCDMNSTHQNEMTTAQLIETMAASYLRALNLGLAVTGSKSGAVAYAEATSTAGIKAKTAALSRWIA
jgi:hypothetical protein